MTSKNTRVGFACNWDPVRETTWSGTPWQLFEGLRRHAPIADLGIQLPTPVRRSFQIAHARRSQGKWHSEWKWSRSWDRLATAWLTRSARQAKCEVLLQVQDLALLDIPYFSYQDLSVDSLLEYERTTGQKTPAFEFVSDRVVQRWAERQRRFYDGAVGVFAMSEWLAESLATTSGVARERIHVVHPGINVPVDVGRAQPDQRRRLLFIGRDFERKAGPLVVAAFNQLRAEALPDLQLTVCGPTDWPMQGAPPAGVTFAGSLSAQEVAELYLHHDLFVMPSRFEAFGIVFAEALAAGLPCIARNAWAMPEMVKPQVNGDLISGDDPDELASKIYDVLHNDEIYDNCKMAAIDQAAYFSWDRAAKDMLTHLHGALS